jgi:hypothetical protein
LWFPAHGYAKRNVPALQMAARLFCKAARAADVPFTDDGASSAHLARQAIFNKRLLAQLVTLEAHLYHALFSRPKPRKIASA